MTAESENWQLGHRIEEPWGQAATWWERHPVTVMRPARGRATARLLCMTCDEAVGYVVLSARTRKRLLRRRRWLSWIVSLLVGLGLVVLAGSTLGALFGGYFMAAEGEWWVAAGSVGLAVVHGWGAAAIVPYLRPRAPLLLAGEDVRLADPSPVHELREI